MTLRDEFEKWVNNNEDLAAEFSNGDYVISSYKIRTLFAGKALAPVEPTHEMIRAGQIASRYWSASDSKENGLAPIYRAMIAASQERTE